MLKLNFLILDCGCENFGHGGTLNHFFTATAKDLLTELGHNVEVTRVGDEWSIPEEVKKILKADVIIVQTPGWCMGPPWQFKRYENMVLVQPEVVEPMDATQQPLMKGMEAVDFSPIKSIF